MILQGDCLNLMAQLSPQSVDMVLCDLPYGVTQNKWDVIIPFADLWQQYERITKPRAAIVLTASQPFTSLLICSNQQGFKYCWVWDKVNRVNGHLNAKKQPLRQTEDIVVFYREQPTYCPQMTQGKPYTAISHGRKSSNYGQQADNVKTICEGERYPRNLISIPADERGSVGRIHPTQKPVALMEYLIKTYTMPGDVVLDNCMGSGTTGVAAKRLCREFVGMELDTGYFEAAKQRIGDSYAKDN